MKHLSANAKLIYLIVLPLLEGRRGVGSGGTIYAGYREIAEELGLSYHSSMGNLLRELAGFGLINFKPGQPYRKDKIAAEISRNYPCPDVPDIYRHKLQKSATKDCSK
jgi:Cdc6-like AAA superfamily ATPase